MGTRSRIILRRYKNRDITLWLHWDGYFTGVGVSLITQILKLVAYPADKNNRENLIELLEKIKISYDIEEINNDDISYTEEGVLYKNKILKQFNSAEDLKDLIFGKYEYIEDSSSHISYEYVIDFYKQELNGRSTDNDEHIKFSWD